MATRLTDLVEPEMPAGFTYERAESKDMIEKYGYLLAEAYGMPEFGWDRLAGCLIHCGVRDDYQHYIGYYNGKPVATSSLLYDDGVAGLYNVANLPEVRGKGIGSMISYVPFIDALDRGYEIGILHSSRMGYNVYKRLGFEEICKLIRYSWSPSSDTG
jgi:GNAT superfamily N-acetyltransferase